MSSVVDYDYVNFLISFWFGIFSSIYYSIWNPDFEAKRISIIFSYSRNYSKTSRIPRCRLQRGVQDIGRHPQVPFWIPVVIYIHQRFCWIINQFYFCENTERTIGHSQLLPTPSTLNLRCNLWRRSISNFECLLSRLKDTLENHVWHEQLVLISQKSILNFLN
jgi:hypothetical protein